jgi:1,4-alpha-glucan branching enzyme
LVRFTIFAPEAREVSIVGDFNGWDPAAHPLARGNDGWWTRDLDLPPGTYQYLVAVDGQLRLPETAPETIDDGFGGRNALVRVSAPSE